MINPVAIDSIESKVTRLGIVLEPNGDPSEAEGVLNPAATRTRDGKLLLFPRVVSSGNRSSVGIVEVDESGPQPAYRRAGFALVPEAPYELRDHPGGFGCEDPRVTFMEPLDAYVMVYTAYGPQGPRIAFALSPDGYGWTRLGLADFSAPGLPAGDDKDGAFFPEPVISPRGALSLAFYHRPMLHISAVDGRSAVPMILDLPPHERECTRIAYVPLEPALADRRNLLKVAESILVLEPAVGWGALKNGAGTPPVRIEEGWFSLFHAVDGRYDESGQCLGMRYRAGIVVHDAEQPHVIRYRSQRPVLAPEAPEEQRGIVSDVVFPTGLDLAPGQPSRDFDIYYGMADARVGRARIELGESVPAAAEESAA